MYPFLVNGTKRRFNLVCRFQLHYFQGVRMSLGNPISTFPAGNQRPGLSCLGASRPVVVYDGISAVTRSCQLVTLRFKMSTNSGRPLRQATDTLSNLKATVQFHDGFERSDCLPFCGTKVIGTKIINDSLSRMSLLCLPSHFLSTAQQVEFCFADPCDENFRNLLMLAGLPSCSIFRIPFVI